MNALSRLVLSCAVLSGAAACGQKGPLYLPDKAGEVVTRPAGGESEAPPETAPQPATIPPEEREKQDEE